MNDKLKSQERLSMWNEPLEILNGGPEFLKSVKAFLSESADPEKRKDVADTVKLQEV